MVSAATGHLTLKQITCLVSFGGTGVLFASGGAFFVVEVVAKPLLVLQKKPPPEAYKSPGPPKLAIKGCMLREAFTAKYKDKYSFGGFANTRKNKVFEGFAKKIQGKNNCMEVLTGKYKEK